MADPPAEAPRPDGEHREPTTPNPEKQALITEAIRKVNFIGVSLNTIKLDGDRLQLESKPEVNGIEVAVKNAKPSEPGHNEVEKPTLEVTNLVRRKIGEMSEGPAAAHQKFVSDRLAVEDLLKRIAQEPDPQIAQELAQAATAKFLLMTQGLEETSAGQKNRGKEVAEASYDNLQRVSRVANRVVDEIRRDIRSIWLGEVLTRSKSLAQITEDAKIRLSADDKKLLGESQQNQIEFNQVLQRLAGGENPPKADDVTEETKGTSTPEAEAAQEGHSPAIDKWLASLEGPWPSDKGRAEAIWRPDEEEDKELFAISERYAAGVLKDSLPYAIKDLLAPDHTDFGPLTDLDLGTVSGEPPFEGSRADTREAAKKAGELNQQIREAIIAGNLYVIAKALEESFNETYFRERNLEERVKHWANHPDHYPNGLGSPELIHDRNTLIKTESTRRTLGRVQDSLNGGRQTGHKFTSSFGINTKDTYSKPWEELLAMPTVTEQAAQTPPAPSTPNPEL